MDSTDCVQDKYSRQRELLETSDLTKIIQFNPEHKDRIDNFFGVPESRRIVLLHSVRSANGAGEPEFISKYISEQESLGNAVYIPKIFNFRNDENGGIAIYNTMRYVIQNSGKVAIGYNPESEGIKVDYGMTIASDKQIKLLNFGLDTDDPIYASMKFFDAAANKRHRFPGFTEFFYNLSPILHKVASSRCIPLTLKYSPRPDKDGKEQPPALEQFSALELGMAYASEKPFKILNLDEVMAQADLEDKLGCFKSYSKAALKLHKIYNG